MVRIEFDPAKSARNVATRGLPFEKAAGFDWETALVVEDDRRDYGESRFRALGMIEGALHAMAFTPRRAGIRVISLRRANRRERKLYEQTRNTA